MTTLRARQTRKWTRYPDDVLPAWVAESDFATCEPVLRVLNERVAAESFGYAPDGHELPEALSEFYDARYGVDLDPAHVQVLPDVVRGLWLAVEHLTPPDSAVVVPLPAYPPFLQIPRVAGRERIDVDATDGIDLDEVEDAFRAGAGSMLVCSPHNPLGYTFSRESLSSLVDLADRYGARLLVDEIHAPLVLDGAHTCAAAVSDAAARVCVTLTAASKAWNVAGLKCAQMILTNPDDRETWRRLSGVAKDGVGTLGIFASEACYREGREFLDAEVAHLREQRDWLVTELPRAVPGLRIRPPEATYLMWLDFRQTALAEDPAGLLLRHGKVALNDGRTFGPSGAGHARLNFSTSRENLEEIVDRIAHAAEYLS